MATNQYFNHYYAQNEQDLIEDMVIEAIQIQGLDLVYIPRTQEDISFLYSEDPTNYFEGYKKIEMYPASVEGLDGEELMSIFGNEFKKTATFVVSKKRFSEVMHDEDDEDQITKPKEGDLLFMPVTNTVFEINYVDKESPYFEKGKKYVYELRVETFNYSYEEIETEIEEVDDILERMLIDDPSDLEDDDFADNEELNDEKSNVVFNPNNPFGIN